MALKHCDSNQKMFPPNIHTGKTPWNRPSVTLTMIRKPQFFAISIFCQSEGCAIFGQIITHLYFHSDSCWVHLYDVFPVWTEPQDIGVHLQVISSCMQIHFITKITINGVWYENCGLKIYTKFNIVRDSNIFQMGDVLYDVPTLSVDPSKQKNSAPTCPVSRKS